MIFYTQKYLILFLIQLFTYSTEAKYCAELWYYFIGIKVRKHMNYSTISLQVVHYVFETYFQPNTLFKYTNLFTPLPLKAECMCTNKI